MAMIHLVRHGQAAAGFGTHKDPGLDDLGRQQATAVAAMLEPLGPMPIWSSPLARAFETAEPLAALWQQQIKIETRVAEIPSPTEDLAARAQWLGQAMQGNWSDLAEEFQSWRSSLADCLLQLDHDCVMFSHYVAINAAVGTAQQDPRMRVFAPDNCSVTTLNNSGGVLTVETLGRTADTRIN
jgi:broad specificity phosphatase PhoE